MTPQVIARVFGIAALVVIGILIVFRKRLGVLNTASWLVVLGAFVLLSEHPQFAISYTIPLESIVGEVRNSSMRLLPHARIHFFMAGIYAIIGLILLCVIARTLLKTGQRIGWY